MNKPITPERAARVRQLFEEFSELPEESYSSFLKILRGKDANLEKELVSLLQYSKSESSGIDTFTEGVLQPVLKALNEDPSGLKALMEESSPIPLQVPGSMVGKRVSHFDVKSLLGHGGMGEVYLAYDRDLMRNVALKFLPPDLSANKAAKARLLKEARAESALEHDNIATVHEIGETEDHQLFIAMAYYDGVTLKEKIAEDPIPVDSVIDYAIQLASGIAEAHGKGITHQDIKPGNIIITRNDSLKLLDFGIARLRTTSRAELHQSGGTIAYMSPEQLLGDSADASTDIWAIGVNIYEMLTGQSPFAGRNAQETVKAILDREPPSLIKLRPDVPADLAEIVDRCLAKESTGRYRYVNQLLEDLRACQTPNPVEQPPTLYKRTLLYASLVVIPVFCVLTLNYLITDKVSSSEIVDTLGEKSLAVLPFDNLSDNAEDSYFADGFHGDILNHVSGLGSLKVISRTSVMTYRNTDKNLQTIADELGVAFILEGGVSRSGDQVRINVQLIDSVTDKHLWANSYDRTITAANVFAIQSEIALSIATTLEAVLSPEEMERINRVPTQNMDALEAYFKGMEGYLKLTEAGVREAIPYFEKAISMDPGFALAHVRLGICHRRLSQYAGLPDEQVVEIVEPHILKALELDDTLGEAHAQMGLLRMKVKDYIGAEAELKIAIELNPSHPNAYLFYAGLQSRFGNRTEADELYKRALELAPVESNQTLLATILEREGQYEEALKVRELSVVKDPQWFGSHVNLGNAYRRMNRFDDAIVAYRKAHALNPNSAGSSIMQCYQRLGDMEAAEFWENREYKSELDPIKRGEKRVRWIRWLWSSGNKVKMEEYAVRYLDNDPTHLVILRILTEHFLATDRPQSARAMWEKAYPSLFEMNAKVEEGNLWPATYIAMTMRATNEEAHADYLIRKSLAIAESMPQDPNSMVLEATLLLTAGDDHRALDNVLQHIDAGVSSRILHNRQYGVYLRPILTSSVYLEKADAMGYTPRSSPMPVISKPQRSMADQLQRIRELEANGELAPIPALPR